MWVWMPVSVGLGVESVLADWVQGWGSALGLELSGCGWGVWPRINLYPHHHQTYHANVQTHNETLRGGWTPRVFGRPIHDVRCRCTLTFPPFPMHHSSAAWSQGKSFVCGLFHGPCRSGGSGEWSREGFFFPGTADPLAAESVPLATFRGPITRSGGPLSPTAKPPQQSGG